MPENPYRHGQLYEHLARSATACPERAGLDQATPVGMRPAGKCCVRCGRVTARRDGRGMPWCGGQPVTPEQWAVEESNTAWRRRLPMDGLEPAA